MKLEVWNEADLILKHREQTRLAKAPTHFWRNNLYCTWHDLFNTLNAEIQEGKGPDWPPMLGSYQKVGWVPNGS